MGTILIDKNYRINSDSRQWVLEENRPVQDKDSQNYGKDNWVTLASQTRIELIFNKLLDMKLKELPTLELKEFLKEAKKLKVSIKEEFDITV